ncbi:MAG: cache domain-containing protein [Deltaproteobacteria bacterium]|nr:cache domain-containing protein [Deltaproteobacteria bacterium]
MNIGSKFILSFLLVTLVPTILLALLTTTIISGSKKDDAQETINHNLKAAWMQYYARAYQMQYGMLQASTESYIKDAIVGKNQTFLKKQMAAWKKFRPYVDLWAVVDDRAVTIASNNTSRVGVRLSFNGLVEKSIKKKTSYISSEKVSRDILVQEGLAETARVPAALDDKDGKGAVGDLKEGIMLLVVTPVMDDKNSVIGAIITGDLINNDPFIPDTLAESIPGSLVTIAMEETQIATNVMDESGQRTVGQRIPKDVLEEIRMNKGFRGETSIGNRSYITAFDPIINYDGRIIGSLFVGVPREKFVELQYKNIKAVVTIAVIGLFLASVVASFITYMITRPIKSLTRKAQLVSSGNLNIHTTFKEGNDEIADLARTFDIMVTNLRENEDRIKVSRDKMRQQTNLIESIINSLPYCLYVIERNMGIVAWNRHASLACPICKCGSEDECQNMNFITHLPNDELKEGLEKVIREVFATGEPRHLEQKVSPKERGAKELVVRTSVFPIFSERRMVENVVWMAEDVTKKKEIEASVISSEKLAAIGQLAAGIAHEVNNPLGGILNCLYNFKNRKLTDERKIEYLDFMEEGMKRVQNIVRQLLDFSQQHAPALSLTDINGMIEGIVPLFIHSIKDRDIRLVKNLGTGLPPILVDKHQIEQILVNLILNAIQSLEGEGLIEISTRFEGNWYCILVSDNGCGIPPENIPRIFDPFFTTKGVGKGTGLGLSVSRGIIERHKGRIDVESKAGKGTVFKVSLPIAS